MAIVRINGKTINTVNGKKVRAIHYGDKTWILYEDVPYTYTIANDEVTITGYTGTDTEIVIPTTIEGYNVTTIGASAFANQDNLTKVTIPSTIKTMQENAFNSIYDLQYVKYLGTIEDWCNITFANETATPFGANTFNHYFLNSNDELLEEIEVPNTVTQLNDYAFLGFNRVSKFILNENITHIGKWAFHSCYILSEINVPSTVTTIGDLAFAIINVACLITFEGSIPPDIGLSILYNSNSSRIKVPSGYAEIYKTWDSNWEAIADKIVSEGSTLTFNVDSSIYNYDDYFYSLDSGSTWNAIDSATMTIENVSKIRFKATSGTYGMNIGTSSGGSDIASVLYRETEDIFVTADATWYFDSFGGGAGN